MKRLLVATGNRHKTAELGQMLGPDWALESLVDHPGLEPAVEDGLTFEENAIRKAVGISEQCPGRLVLADDSGLEVDALDGEPGVRSARYAGEDADDAANRIHLLAELGRTDRVPEVPLKARFRCVLALARDGRCLSTFEGRVEGQVIGEERGDSGFGYDSLFVPEGHERTFGEMTAREKQSMSHRARALVAAVATLESTGR